MASTTRFSNKASNSRPLIVDGQVIGALGVAGAGGAAGDEGCAMAAIRQHLPAN